MLVSVALKKKKKTLNLKKDQPASSVGKGACHQAWHLEFSPQDPTGRRSCPLTSTYGLWQAGEHSSGVHTNK